MALNALAFIFFFLPKSIFNYFWGKEKNRINITYYSTRADLSQERAPRQVHTIHHPDGLQCGEITTGTSSSTPSGSGTTPAGGDDPNAGND